MFRRCRRRRGEEGASLVEFALLLPIFMMLVLGMFSGGLTYNQKLSMTNAAREGARYGATLQKTTLDGTEWATAVKTVALERASGDVKEAAGNPDQGICVALVQSDGSTVFSSGGSDYRYQTSTWTDGAPSDASCFDDNLTDSGCRVHVMVAREGEIEALLFTATPSMKSTATARYEESC